MQTQTSETAESLGSPYIFLIERCLVEVLLCYESKAAKAYTAALVKTAAGLSLAGISQADAATLKALSGDTAFCLSTSSFSNSMETNMTQMREVLEHQSRLLNVMSTSAILAS